MNIPEQDLNKIMDALMSRDEMQCLVAQSLIVTAKDARADPALISEAQNLFGFDEIEIDDDAGTSESDSGTWVQAWVYVPKPEETECGQCEGTGRTQSASNLKEEECPVCDGTGQIAP